jgi:hypothetical protein
LKRASLSVLCPRLRPRGLSIVVASLLAASMLAGCGGKSYQDAKPGQDFVYLLDRKSVWTEDKITALPPLPGPSAQLLPFDVSSVTSNTYAVDAKSVSVGSDGVVRFTVVIVTPSGARNVYYEGIRCDTYEWRRYASVDDTGHDWDQTVANNWRRIETSQLNAYHGALYSDYMCASKSPTGSAPSIVQNMRYKRTSMSKMY